VGGIHGIPTDWVEQTPEAIKDEAERRSGVSVGELERRSVQLAERAKALHIDVCVALAPARNQPDFERESALLDELEEMKFEHPSLPIARALKPKQQMTRDSFAGLQGIQIALTYSSAHG
jgi:hypothetical protein